MTIPKFEAAQKENFIRAMRRVSTSVTVVTTDGPAGRHGATVSAFSSVSAEPPMVLVCLNRASQIASKVERNGIFCVNVLRQEQAGIADRFAGRHDGQIADRFEGIELMEGERLAPIIAGANAFLCQVAQSIDVGTHLVVMGQVKKVVDKADAPLTYFNGAYHHVTPAETRFMNQHEGERCTAITC